MAPGIAGNFYDRGAEAIIQLVDFNGLKLVLKKRLEKPYRHPLFNEQFIRQRTRTEASILADLIRNGIKAPAPILVDVDNGIIVMEYIEGVKIADIISSLGPDEARRISADLGCQVGKMHGLEIFHGDLTLSNIMYARNGDIYIIDFGLAGYSKEFEEYAIDLHLLERSLRILAPGLAGDFFSHFIEGYGMCFPGDHGAVLDKMREIRLRGRYVSKELRRIFERESYVEGSVLPNQ